MPSSISGRLFRHIFACAASKADKDCEMEPEREPTEAGSSYGSLKVIPARSENSTAQNVKIALAKLRARKGIEVAAEVEEETGEMSDDPEKLDKVTNGSSKRSSCKSEKGRGPARAARREAKQKAYLEEQAAQRGESYTFEPRAILNCCWL
jgi:hypothetical protein